MAATKRDFILSSGIGISANDLYIVGSTASTNSTSGALIVNGGVGIGDSVSVGGRLQMFNAANYTAFVSSATGNTVYTLPATSPATGTSVLQSTSAGVLSWVPMVASGSAGGAGTVYDGSLNSIPYYPTAGTAITGSSSFTNTGTSINIGYTTAATNSSSGALTVVGGVGIGDSLFVAGNISFNTGTNGLLFRKLVSGNFGAIYSTNVTPSTTNYTMITDGASVNFNGTSGVYFNISNTNKIQVTSTNINIVPVTESTSASTGALTIAGGVGIGGSLYVASATAISGVTINAGIITGSLAGTATTATNVNVVAATTSANHPLLFTPTSGSASGVAVSSKSTLVYNPLTDILSISGISVTSSTASTTTTTGSLIATGGVGIGQSVSVGGRLQLFNSANYTAFVSSATGNTVYTLPATSPATGSSVLQSTSAGVMSWVPMTAGSSSGNTSQNIVINTAGNANIFHPVLFTPSSLSAGSAVSSDSTITFNPSTEILNVSGLAITSGTASTNTTTGALVVRGGLGVTGQLSFATASFGFTGITTNPTMSFIGATSSSPITLTVLTDNSLNWEGSQGSVFSIDSNLSTGEIFSVSDISGLPIISASAGQTVNINEFGGFTQIGNGSINSSSTTTGSLVISGGLGLTGNANIGGTVRITNTTNSSSSTSGALVLTGGVGIGLSASIGGRLQLFNSANYTAFVSSATGNTVYTLPATSPATGTSYLTSDSAGIMSWTAPTKTNYVLSFGAGFTPTASSADSVSLNIPYTPDGTTKYYYVKRIEYRNETLSGGTGLSFYLQRHTSGNASWTTTNTITAGSGASFLVGAAVYSSSFTTISSSAGVAGSVVSGDYVRLFFTSVGSAANVSIAMTIEEQ